MNGDSVLPQRDLNCILLTFLTEVLFVKMTSRTETTIDRATPDDVPGLEAIVKAAYSKYVERIGTPPAPMLADYRQLLKTQDVYVLRNGDKGTTVGSIILSVDDTQGSVKINNVVVDPSAQGRGYGRLLMDHAEAVARSKGLGALTLFTNVKMFENIGLYNKLGFIETERRTEGPYERVYFRRNLS
jgi:ribosomal protein S18 acetylase RimI-like enzyme